VTALLRTNGRNIVPRAANSSSNIGILSGAGWQAKSKVDAVRDGLLGTFVDGFLNVLGGRCEQCGWSRVHPITGLVPLTVNHCDGDSENHRPENLELLCGGCHALTPNYGKLNNGRGRKKRLAKLRAAQGM
jgi:hypothetical protein